MDDQEFWTEQGAVTDPGEFASLTRAVPGSVAAIRAAARGLVFHYRADGDFAENGITADRVAEIDTRYAKDMLGRLVSLADQPLARPADAKPAPGWLLPRLHGAVPVDRT